MFGGIFIILCKMSYKQYNFLEQVTKDMIRRFGTDYRRIAVVFNNQRPIQYLNAYLASEINQVFWSPQYFTIQEFVKQSSPYTELNPTAQAFALSQAYAKLQQKKFPGYQEDIAAFFPLAELILADFAQLDYEMTPVDQLFHHLEDLTEIDSQFDYLTDEQKEYLRRFWSSFSNGSTAELQQKFLGIWKLLPALYRDFETYCQQEHVSTVPKMYRDLAEGQRQVQDPLENIDAVLFIGFNALNACEKVLFKRWQDEGKAYFYFDVDAHYLEDRIHEAGHFFRENFGNYQLKNALGDPLRNIQRLEKEVTVIQAPGQVAQAKLLHPIVEKDWFERKGSKAIILADESLLVPVVQSLPPLNYNITMGFPIQESLSFGLFHVYLEIQLSLAKQTKKRRRGIAHALLMDFVGHPRNGLAAAMQSALLEELSKVQREELSLSEVKSLVDRHIRVPSGIIARFLEPSTSGMDFLKNVEALWEHTFLQHHPDETRDNLEKALSENALQVLQSLQQMLEKFPDIGIPMAIRLLRKVTLPVTATLSGDPFQDIQIMGILESRSLNFDHIVLLGANEGFLPTLKSAPSLIPYHIRKAYRLPVLENQNGLSAYLFYRLFHNGPSCHILYNSLVTENSSGELSRFVRQMEYETSVDLVFREIHLGSSPKFEDSIEAGTSVETTISTIQKNGKVWEKLERYLDGSDLKLSATAFTTYLQSPLLFFFKYLSGIPEPPVLRKGMEKNLLGDLVHKIMELCYERFRVRQETISATNIQDCLENLDFWAAQAFLAEFGHDVQEAQEEMTVSIAQRYARRFLEFDRDHVAPFTILELENKDDYVWELPVTVLGRPRRIRLRGVIDRIDRLESPRKDQNPPGTIRIVDYKTGRDELQAKRARNASDTGAGAYFEGFMDPLETAIPENKAFIQTLFYTLIYEKVSAKQQVEPNLYTFSNLAKGQSKFVLCSARNEDVLIEGSQNLAEIKESFRRYLVYKLEELFDPVKPFHHPVKTKLYESDPFRVFLESIMPDTEEDTQID